MLVTISIPYKLIYNSSYKFDSVYGTVIILSLLILALSFTLFSNLGNVIRLIRDCADLIVMHHRADTRGENGEGRVRKRVGQESTTAI